MGFNHSVKVPTQYKKSAAVLREAFKREKSLKNLIFEEKHARTRGLQSVIKHYIQNRAAIENAIEQTGILTDNPRLEPTLCKILVSEIIYGRKQLNGDSKPVQTVREYKDRLLAVIGGESIVSASNKDTKPRYVRVNTNLLSLDEAFEFLATEEWRKKEQVAFDNYADFLAAIGTLEEDEFMVDMHVSNLLIFHPKQKYYWACHAYVKEKKFMLQDKGTSLVAELLQPPPESVVLDMCAAPGMKTIHISNIMQNRGTIFAVEHDERRFKLLNNFTTSAGCKIVKTIHADALTMDSTKCPYVDYIMVDPSCTGSGIQNRLSLENDEKNPERLKKLAGLQIKMLLHAMTAFPTVKRISYSTCSLYEEENEQVIQRCLELHPEFKLLSAKKALRNKWANVGNSDYKKIGKNCIYTRPNEDLADGIFIAILEKRHDGGME